ncbi:hypothetical protein Tco_0839186 [Tanacetum coccineum]|uniref:Uncharacterized protein n=1 Tax=Tanacetum coccineum TaxID=301880 RepID=A0ABQ5AUF5_9ASTR
MKIVGYQGSVDKVSAFYTKNLAQPWQTIIKFFNRCLTSRKSGYDQTKINILLIFHAVINRVHVDYVDLLCVYTMGNVTVKEMPIPDDLLIDAIRDRWYKVREWKTLLAKDNSRQEIYLLRERDEIHEANLLSLTMHKTVKAIEERENVAIIQEKLIGDDINKIVNRDDDSEATKFDDFVYLNDEEDSGDRLEPKSHKDKPKTIDDEEEEKKKKDDKKDGDDSDDHTDYASIKDRVIGSLEIRQEKMHTPIPSPSRSHRKDLSLDKAIDQELIVFVTTTPASTSTQDHSKPSSSSSLVEVPSEQKHMNDPVKWLKPHSPSDSSHLSQYSVLVVKLSSNPLLKASTNSVPSRSVEPDTFNTTVVTTSSAHV